LLIESLAKHLSEKFESDNAGLNLLDDSQAKQRLIDAAADAVIELSKKSRIDINIPYITATTEGAKHLKCSVSGSVLKSVVKDSFSIEKEVRRRANPGEERSDKLFEHPQGQPHGIFELQRFALGWSFLLARQP